MQWLAPAACVVLAVLAVPFVYLLYNVAALPPLGDVSNVADAHSRRASERDFAAWERGQVPTIVDLPAPFVSRRLHAPGRPGLVRGGAAVNGAAGGAAANGAASGSDRRPPREPSARRLYEF